MFKKTMVFAAAACLLVATTACGDDDSEGGSGGTRSEIAAILLEDSEGEATPEQADCIAGGMIDLFGEDEARAFADDPDNWEPDIDEEDITAAMELMTGMFAMIEDCGIDLEGDAGAIDMDEIDMEELNN